ncbi:hypothetical protein HY449_01775 [Candidatus Pacearchaeota archaeon]|nr:hypothetical protein [Candidatus Pacearchaeota archaeon]
MKKEILTILFFAVTLSFSPQLIFAAESCEVDIPGYEVFSGCGLPQNTIYGQGNFEIAQQNNEIKRISCLIETCDLDTKGSSFKGIYGQDLRKAPVVADVNAQGELVNADLTLKEGTFTLQKVQATVPADTQLKFNSETGINLRIPPSSTLPSFPTSVQAPGLKDYLTTMEGSNVRIPGDFLMSGKINSFQGRLYSVLSDETSLNNVKIGNKLANLQSTFLKENDLFFDGVEHGKIDVSFGKNNLIVESNSGKGAVLTFNKGNPYIPVSKDGDVAIQPADSKIEVQNTGTIPKITAKGNSIILNGATSIEIKDDNVLLSKKSTNADSSKIEIEAKNKAENSLTREHKIVADNSNKISVVSTRNLNDVRISYNSVGSGFLQKTFGKIISIFRDKANFVRNPETAVVGIKG